MADKDSNSGCVWIILITVGILLYQHWDKASDLFSNTKDDRIEYTSSSVTLEIYPPLFNGFGGAPHFEDDIEELNKKIFKELRKNKYSGDIAVYIRYKTKNKYGHEEISPSQKIGVLNVEELKKYDSYSYYEPKIKRLIMDNIEIIKLN